MESCIHVTTPDGFLRNEDCFKQKYFVCEIDQNNVFIKYPTGDISLSNNYIQGHSVYNNTEHFSRSQVENLSIKGQKSISYHTESSI